MGTMRLSDLPQAQTAGSQDKILVVQNGVTQLASLSLLNQSEHFWCDIDFPIIIRTTGTNIPVQTTFQGNLTAPIWAVNDYNVCEGQELIHPWIEGSTCYWHVHITTSGTNVDARYVRFEVEYTFAPYGTTYPANTILTSPDMLIPANTPALTHLIFSIGNFTPTDAKIATHVKARLKRVAAAGTAPTANVFCEMLQMHVQIDTTGSHQMQTK